MDNEKLIEKDDILNSPRIRLKAKLRDLKKLAQMDVSKFKVGSAYHVNGQENTIFMINEIGPHPLDRLPCGYGTLIKVDSTEPMYLYLHQLGDRFIE